MTDPPRMATSEADAFDPAEHTHIGTAQHFRWLGGVVKAVLVLNLLDAVFTTIWVATGLASEANPLLADLVTHQPVVFVLAKTTLVGLGSLLLWSRRGRPAAVIGVFTVFLVYYAILLYHLGFAGWIAPDLF